MILFPSIQGVVVEVAYPQNDHFYFKCSNKGGGGATLVSPSIFTTLLVATYNRDGKELRTLGFEIAVADLERVTGVITL